MNTAPLHGQTRYHECCYRGCHRAATCVPRLYVPISVLSPNRNADDASALMGMPVCETCFSKLTAEEFLAGEQGQQIRAAITAVLAERGAYPNFDKATLGRVSPRDHDFGRFEQMQERSRAN